MRTRARRVAALALAGVLGSGLAGYAITGTIESALASSSDCRPISQPVSPPKGPPLSKPVSPPKGPPMSKPVSPPKGPPCPPVSGPVSPPLSKPVSPPKGPPVTHPGQHP